MSLGFQDSSQEKKKGKFECNRVKYEKSEVFQSFYDLHDFQQREP